MKTFGLTIMSVLKYPSMKLYFQNPQLKRMFFDHLSDAFQRKTSVINNNNNHFNLNGLE